MSLLRTVNRFFEKYKTSQIVSKLAPPIIHNLFLIWMRSPFLSESYWSQLNEKFALLCRNYETAVTSWKDIVNLLTKILCSIVYNFDTQDSNKPDLLNITWDENKIRNLWIIVLN